MLHFKTIALLLGGEEGAQASIGGRPGIWFFHPLLGRLGKPVGVAGPQVYLVSPSDLLNMNDSQYKLQGVGIPESEAFLDGANRLLGKGVLDLSDFNDNSYRARTIGMLDREDVMDIIRQGRFVTLGDRQDALDSFTKFLNKRIGEQQDITDAATLIRNLVLRLSDTEDVSDLFRKTITKALADIEQILDSVSNTTKRTVGLTDRQDALDGFRKSMSIGTGESQDGADAFVKRLTKVLSDSQELSDSVIAFKQVVKVFSDIVDVLDGIRKGHFVSLPDAQVELDAAFKSITKRLGDSVELTDVFAAFRQAVLQFADTQEIVDSIRREFTKRTGDPVDTADAILKTLNKGFQDAQSYLDGFAKLRGASMSDVQDGSDAVRKELRKRLSESIDVSDLVSISRKLLAALMDTQDVFDGMVKSYTKPMQEDQASGDAATKELRKVLDERVDLFDSVIRFKQAVRFLSDSVDLSETMVKSATKMLGDLGDLLDNRSSGLFKSIGDVQLISDEATVSRLVRLVLLAIADALDLSDEQRKALLKNVGDLNEVRDDVNKFLRSIIGDSAFVSDAMLKSWSKNLSDTVSISDTAAALVKRFLAAADALDLDDEFRKLLIKRSDDLDAFVDSQARALSKAFGDRQDISDDVVFTELVGLIFLAIADELNLSEAQTKSLFKNVGDIAGLLDSPASLLNKSLADVQALTDVAMSARQLIRNLFDDAALSDGFSRSLTKVLADNESAQDYFAKALNKVLADSAEARDDFVKQLTKAANESQSVNDALVKALTKTLLEAQIVGDQAALIRYLTRNVTDEIDLTDAAGTSTITNQLLLDVLETQDVSDEFVKTLVKRLADSEDVSDSALLQVLLAVPLLRQFIESMLAQDSDPQGKLTGGKTAMRMFTGDEDVQGKWWSSKPGIKIGADENDLLDREWANKGKRQK